MKVCQTVFGLTVLMQTMTQLVSVPTFAAEKRYVHIERAEISGGDRAINFSVLYGLQWGGYVLTQRDGIKANGSFQSWSYNSVHPHFDFDGLNFNIFGHSFIGQLYYQYYRAHGYSEAASFLWSFVSSAAFEFTIETVTERPSFQDLYQTPVFGTLVGVGFEHLSFFFHSMDVWPARILGFLFDPFTLIPGASYGFVATPILNPQAPGVAMSWKF